MFSLSSLFTILIFLYWKLPASGRAPYATHWKAADHFGALFNLILYLIEKYNGREVALYCSKVLQIDIDRNSQASFLLFDGIEGHKDDMIREVQESIKQHIGDRLTKEWLAERSAMETSPS